MGHHLLVVQFPMMGFWSPWFNPDLEWAQKVAAYESMLGGTLGVVCVHAVAAIITAPVLAEAFMVVTILFLSFYWVVIVYALMGIYRVRAFAAQRVAESKEGPVLA